MGDIVLSMEGTAQLPLNIVGDIACDCSIPLVLHSVRPDGAYTVHEFTCGKVSQSCVSCNLSERSVLVGQIHFKDSVVAF